MDRYRDPSKDQAFDGRRNDRGLESVEFALISAFMIIAIIAALGFIDNPIENLYNGLSALLDSTGCC